MTAGTNDTTAMNVTGAAGSDSRENEDDGPKTPEEDSVETSLGQLPPTYSSINIPECVNDESHERGDLPPAYSEFP